MGLQTYSKRDLASSSWLHPYGSKVTKSNTKARRIEREFVKASKSHWQQLVSKTSIISSGLIRTFRQAAALARLVSTAAQHVKIRLHSSTVINTGRGLAKPATEDGLTSAVMAQIYSDIDNAWLSGMANVPLEMNCVHKVFELAVLGFRDLEANTLSGKSSAFLRAVAGGTLQPKVVSFQVRVCRRYAMFAKELGWMMLSVLSYSETFRNASRNFDEASWTRLTQSIDQNHVSLELFFKVRGLDWQAPIRRLERAIPPKGLNAFIERHNPRGLAPVFSQSVHSYVVPSRDGNLHRANYQGLLHQDISSNIYDPSAFQYDPSLRNPYDGICCYACGQLACSCEPSTCENVTRPLVELIQCPGNKGIGIRALQRIRKGDVLDEYVGELKHASTMTDHTYALELEHPFKFRRAEHDPILIDAQVYGNWTRYINASCDPSLRFLPSVVGGRYRMMVVATRDIDVFEELTVAYGDGYWLAGPGSDSRMCECNERDCRYADTERKRGVRKGMIMHGDVDMMEI
ncbi:MAG: hypothetical protein Q9201_004132 [Fulgogasparrea decipioides]